MKSDTDDSAQAHSYRLYNSKIRRLEEKAIQESLISLNNKVSKVKCGQSNDSIFSQIRGELSNFIDNFGYSSLNNQFSNSSGLMYTFVKKCYEMRSNNVVCAYRNKSGEEDESYSYLFDSVIDLLIRKKLIGSFLMRE